MWAEDARRVGRVHRCCWAEDGGGQFVDRVARRIGWSEYGVAA
jgi:hypothetical protein